MMNLKSIFALSKWAKITLCVLSIIAVVGIVGTLALNQSVKDETYSANLTLNSQKSLETSNQIAYNFFIDFPKFKPLLRSKSISCVDITQFLWDKRVNQNAIENLRAGGRNVWFESTQDLQSLGTESLGKVEYTIDFSPLLWNIIKIFVATLALTLLLTNTIKHRLTPFGRYDYALALILSLSTLILCVGQVDNGHNWGGDFSGYIAQGIALANGKTAQYIADNTLMMSQCDWLYGPYAYPWGFPLLLAPIYKIFGFNIYAFKSVGIICYALFVGIFYIFCMIRLPRIYATFATLFFAINPTMTSSVANNILSDIPFLLFGFIALIILAKLFGESHRNDKKGVDCFGDLRKSPRNDDSMRSTSSLRGKAKAIHYSHNYGIAIATFGGIFMLFASLIRMNGFVILCALIAMHGVLLAKRFAPNLFKAKILKPFSLIDSPYAWQIHTIPYAIFIVGFAIVSITLSSGTGRHLDYLAEISPQTILRNLSLMKFSLFMPLNTDIDSLLLWLCVPFILFGIYANFRESSTKSIETIFYIIFIVGFFALLLLWIDFEVRFLFLTLPFFVLWCAKGFTLIGKKLFRLSLAMLMVVILLNLVWINARDISFIKSSDISQEDAYSAESKQLYKFIINNTPKNAIIISFKPRILYLNTHRLSFVSPNIKRLNEADFVLWNGKYTSDFDKRSMQDIVSPEFQRKTQLIFQNAEYKLFKVLK